MGNNPPNQNNSSVKKKNKSIEQVITNFKPPIFWKDKEIVKQQINHWPLEKINNMIENDLIKSFKFLNLNIYDFKNFLKYQIF